MSIHIGPGVLGLTLLQEHIGHNLVKLSHQLEHGVVGQMFQGKFTLAGVAWVGLSEDGVTVTWHHLQPGETKALTLEPSLHLHQLWGKKNFWLFIVKIEKDKL